MGGRSGRGKWEKLVVAIDRIIERERDRDNSTTN